MYICNTQNNPIGAWVLIIQHCVLIRSQLLSTKPRHRVSSTKDIRQFSRIYQCEHIRMYTDIVLMQRLSNDDIYLYMCTAYTMVSRHGQSHYAWTYIMISFACNCKYCVNKNQVPVFKLFKLLKIQHSICIKFICIPINWHVYMCYCFYRYLGRVIVLVIVVALYSKWRILARRTQTLIL